MKILIADDEEYTREGIVENIDWKTLGIDEVIQAKDGLAALNAAKWYKPDIILTDIRMPRLDGIDFASQIAKINPRCKVIFITGFMEVDYLKSAIDMGAVAFIEKPLKLENIHDAISKASKELKDKKKSLELSIKNIESLKLRLLNMLIFNEGQDKQLKELVSKIGIDHKTKALCIVIKRKQRDVVIIPAQLEQYLEKAKVKVLVGEWIGQELIITFLYKEKESYRIPIIYKKLSYDFKNLQIGIGFEVEDIKRLKMSYDASKMALNKSFYELEKQLFEIEDVIPQQKVLEPKLYSDFLEILTNHPLDLISWSDDLYTKLVTNKIYHEEQIKSLMKSFVHSILEKDPDIEVRLLDKLAVEHVDFAIDVCENIQELWDFYRQLLNVFQEKVLNQSKYSLLINEVISMIEEHHHKADFSIVDIAEALNFSSAHLNVLFKDEKDVTIKQYLSEYRIEKAKKLLKKSSMKINEIAMTCGFSSSNYFTKAFKEKTSISPVVFRKRG